MGVGLVGRTLGSLGIGNIGAEMFRLAKPFDMNFIAHDPYADARGRAASSASSWSGWTSCSARRDVLAVNCPLTPTTTRHLVNAERARADEADSLPHQHGPRSDRRPEGA